MRIQRVLVGMDFSTTAVAAARWAASFLAPKAELILGHAVDVLPPPVFARGVLPSPDAIRATAHDFAESRLRDLVQLLPGMTARWLIRDGRPELVLAELAHETGADVLVIGPHGERRRPHRLLGTTAERLARGAHLPVIVAGGAVSARPQRILAAVDGSPISRTVLRWTETLARMLDAQVTVFSVVDDATYAHSAAATLAATADAGAASEELEQAMRTEGIAWLRKLGATAVSPERFTASITFGKPGDAILAMADERYADLIVIGRHGTGALGPALLGSTIGTVLHGAPCPVFVVAETEDEIVDEPE